MIGEALRQYTVDFMRNAGRGHAVLAAERRDRLALQDRWLEEAYLAEAGGNVARARYLADWAGRVAS